MALDTIVIDGEPATTLAEMLKPGLKAVFVGINPSPVSVAKGHYYQGTLGRRLWQRLSGYGMVDGVAPIGREDDYAVAQGYGFADLIRKPSARATDLTKQEKRNAVPDLASRLGSLPDRPVIVFVFREALDLCRDGLRRLGFEVFCMPGPYAAKAIEQAVMHEIGAAVSEQRLRPPR